MTEGVESFCAAFEAHKKAEEIIDDPYTLWTDDYKPENVQSLYVYCSSRGFKINKNKIKNPQIVKIMYLFWAVDQARQIKGI